MHPEPPSRGMMMEETDVRIEDHLRTREVDAKPKVSVCACASVISKVEQPRPPEDVLSD
jgi:hypothetical protein